MDFGIKEVWLDGEYTNAFLCVNLTQPDSKWFCEQLPKSNLDFAKAEYTIMTQWNVDDDFDSGIDNYIAGQWIDDLPEDLNDELEDLLADVLDKARSMIQEPHEFELKFGTRNIEHHDNMVAHGYYSGDLALLENKDTNEAYVLFTDRNAHWYYEEHYLTFDSLSEAQDYILSNYRGNEDASDFSISDRIYRDINEKFANHN